MSFRKGTASGIRFVLPAMTPGEDSLQILANFRSARPQRASEDGSEVGWNGGQNILDRQFTLEKNFVGDALLFDFQITTNNLPGDLLKAYTDVEMAAYAAVGKPVGSKARREAKALARERLEEESRDGRFAKHRVMPVMWDYRRGHLYLGTTSSATLARFAMLFEKAFGLMPELDTAGHRAHGAGRIVSVPDMLWIPDSDSMDGLGAEFMMWLWYYGDGVSDTITVEDGTEVMFMIQHTLVAECPQGNGRDTFCYIGPSRLPEAKRAARAGKLPRRMRLATVRDAIQHEFQLSAETLAIGSAKITVEDDVRGPAEILLRRIELWRDLNDTVDLLYKKFLAVRSESWKSESEKIANWLAR